MNELKHYGIPGQKWGTRRWQYQDGRFNAEGKARYFGTPKKMATYEMSDNGRRSDYNRNKGDYETENKEGTKIFNRKMPQQLSVEECAKRNNPGIKMNKEGIRTRAIVAGSNANCTRCTSTMELQMRGYDVVTSSIVGAQKNEAMSSAEYINKFYKNPKIDSVDYSEDNTRAQNYELLKETINKYPDGSRGDISVEWLGGVGGHSMFWQKDKNGIKFIDSQVNKIYDEESFYDNIFKSVAVNSKKDTQRKIDECNETLKDLKRGVYDYYGKEFVESYIKTYEHNLKYYSNALKYGSTRVTRTDNLDINFDYAAKTVIAPPKSEKNYQKVKFDTLDPEEQARRISIRAVPHIVRWHHYGLHH